MKVGLFGDSFVEDHLPCRLLIPNKIAQSLKNSIPAYWEILRERGISIENFGQGGSDIHYSYRLFKEHHRRFEKNVFVITHPTRISIPYKKKRKQKQFDWIHGTNAETSLISIHTHINAHDVIGAQISEGIHAYHTKVGFNNSSRDYVLVGAIIDSILAIRPDTLLINAFNTWSPMCTNIKKTNTLYDIHCIENRIMGLSTNKVWPDYNGKIDQRRAHISSESHRILAHDLDRYLQSDKTWFDFDLQPYESLKVHFKDWFVSDNEIPGWLAGKGIFI